MSKLSNQNLKKLLNFSWIKIKMIYIQFLKLKTFQKLKKLFLIFEDTQSKTESELIEHIKTFLPNKKNNEKKLK